MLWVLFLVFGKYIHLEKVIQEHVQFFLIKYLQSFGFKINNEPFKENAKYFRGALVLANANPRIKTNKYLDMFIDNILFNAQHKLEIE